MILKKKKLLLYSILIKSFIFNKYFEEPKLINYIIKILLISNSLSLSLFTLIIIIIIIVIIKALRRKLIKDKKY